MSRPATLDSLRALMFGSVRKIGRSFTRPDDDWAMVMMVQTPQGAEVVPLANELFANGASKEVLGELLRRYVAVRGAYRYALLLNSHVAVEPTQEQLDAIHRGELRIEQIEGASELLTLLVGDAEEEQVWTAEIVRDSRLVRKHLPWERLDTKEGHSLSGRFVGMNEYLRRARST